MLQSKLSHVLLFYALFQIWFVPSLYADAPSSSVTWIKKEDDHSEFNSPHEDWRKKIFGKKTFEFSCEILSKGLQFDKISDPELVNVIQTIRSAVAEMKWRPLLPLFHPRLKVKQETIEGLFSTYQGTYGGKNFDVVPYRLWALNSPAGKAELIECTEDKLSLRSFYGYPLQMGLLLQISGQNEIGHAYVSLVPKDKKWVIGAWHRMQWTHNGKDPETWINAALATHKTGNTRAAYAQMDIAYKLLDGGGFVYYQIHKDAQATRDSWFTPDKWQEFFVKALPETEIVYAGTAFAEDGAGILLRYMVNHEEAANKLREQCLNIGKKLYKEEWTKPLGGLKCQMVTKFETKTREGVLGGNFFTAEDLRE